MNRCLSTYFSPQTRFGVRLLGVLLTPLAVALPATAAFMEDFDLSESLGLTGVQSILPLIQVNPTSPILGNINVNVLVSYGTVVTGPDPEDTFTGMFFEFINQSSGGNSSSSITNIQFQTDALESDPYFTAYSGPQVSYTVGTSNNGPDGGFTIDFNDELIADPTNQGGYVKNGITTGEHFLVGYTIADGNTYQSVLESLLLGGPDYTDGWTIAAHLQTVTGLEDIDSIWLASYTEDQTSPFDDNGGGGGGGGNPVPVPAAAGLGFLGMALIGVMRRKKS